MLHRIAKMLSHTNLPVIIRWLVVRRVFTILWAVMGIIGTTMAPSACVHERITSFVSDITIVPDGTLQVQETITVANTGTEVVHGLVREFPTNYPLYLLFTYTVPFQVTQAMIDGVATTFSLGSRWNGYNVYIGSRSTELTPGTHVFTLQYTTSRQLGFFKEHDELYWNVTGNGWRFPIEHAVAHVHLPPGVVADTVTVEGYTGPQGARGTDYKAHIRAQAQHGVTVDLKTTTPLYQGDGCTVVVTWPKGFVVQPTGLQKLWWFVVDNELLLMIFFGIFLFLLLVMYNARQLSSLNAPGTVIARFYPPYDVHQDHYGATVTNDYYMPPSAVGYMTHRKMRSQFLGADIIDLAVHGYLTIEYQKTSFLTKGTYTLRRVEDTGTDNASSITSYQKFLLESLFAGARRSITLDSSERVVFHYIARSLEHRHKAEYVSLLTAYKQGVHRMMIGCLVITGMSTIVALVKGVLNLHLTEFLIYNPIMWIVAWVISASYRCYTKKGRSVQDEIDGFADFLRTTESERMKIIGTPPTKSPELYEKYLPYAMVFGCEESWTRQFSALFEHLAREGKPYQPAWYIGGTFDGRSFAHGFTQSAISSARTPPGSASGAGGMGSSGGGGGGGGGGGF